MEKILAFSNNRPIILQNLISNDKYLKSKLKNIFTRVDKHKNKLGAEFCSNLENFSIIRKLLDVLDEKYNNIKIKFIKYDYLISKLNYSVINYLYNSLIEHVNKNYYFYHLNKKILKQITKDYYSSLNDATLTLLPNEKNYLDLEYLSYIEELNKYSKIKNKIKQKIKLILLFDDNEFYHKINYIIKYPNIYYLEIIFKDNKIHKFSLFNNLNLYLSSLEHLENINKIFFHNIIYDNSLNNNKEINNSLYQSLLSYLLDEYYLYENDKYQIKLMQNIKEINIEDITFIYIYEKMKIYYCINDIFPSLYSFNKKIINPKNIQYNINDKIMIINNKDVSINIKDIIYFINTALENNKNIKYLLVINHNKLIKDENESDKNIKVNVSDLKELMYISEFPDNNEELIEQLSFFINDSNDKYNIYEGYNDENKLLYFRKGISFIQSCDLIDIFKFNKNISTVKLKNEQIMINYNKERTHLKILNINPIKNELNYITNAHIKIQNFTNFIYNQDNLIELTINKFDYNFNELINTNIKILNINYEKDITVFKYKLIDENSKHEISKLFPNLTNLNISCNSFWILDLKVKDFPQNLTSIKILLKSKNKKISNFVKKFKKYKKEVLFEFIETKTINKEKEYEDIDEEDENDEYESDEFDEPVNNYKGELDSKNAIGGIKGKGKIVEKYDSSHTMIPSRIINENFIKYSENVNKSISLFEYSKIMKEYKSVTKNKNKLYYFSLSYRIKDFKLKYRASDHKKFNIKDLFNLENLFSKRHYAFVMKIIDNIYFFMESMSEPNSYIYRNVYFMTADEIFDIITNRNLKLFVNDSKLQLLDCFSLDNFTPQGIFETDIKFEKKYKVNKSFFYVEDIEIFELLYN